MEKGACMIGIGLLPARVVCVSCFSMMFLLLEQSFHHSILCQPAKIFPLVSQFIVFLCYLAAWRLSIFWP